MKLADLLKHASLKGVFTSLNAALTPDLVAQFTADQKADVEALRTALGAAGTPPEEDAMVSVNMLAVAAEPMARLVVAAQTRAAALVGQLAEAQTSLNRLRELDGQVASGDLVPKSSHDAAVLAATNTARDSAITGERARNTMLTELRGLWTKCSLPSPPDEVLEAEAEPAVRSEAIKRFDTLKTCGLTLEDVKPEVLWAPDNVWAMVSGAVEKARAKRGGNPLAGGGTPAPEHRHIAA